MCAQLSVVFALQGRKRPDDYRRMGAGAAAAVPLPGFPTARKAAPRKPYSFSGRQHLQPLLGRDDGQCCMYIPACPLTHLVLVARQLPVEGTAAAAEDTAEGTAAEAEAGTATEAPGVGAAAGAAAGRRGTDARGAAATAGARLIRRHPSSAAVPL